MADDSIVVARVTPPEVISVKVCSEGSATIEVNSQPSIQIEASTLGIPGPVGPSGPVGPPGPKGDKGEGYQNYEHNQISPQSVWTITHGLNRLPSVIILDSMGEEVEGDIEYIDSNNVVVTFSAEFSGRAICN